MRLPRIRRAQTRRKRLVHGLLVRLALGLTVAAICTFFAVHTVLQNRLDRQLSGTAQLVNQYANAAPAGQLPDFSRTPSSDSAGHALGGTGLLPIFIQLRDADNRVRFQAPSGSGPT